MSWILLSVMAALLWAGANIIDKYVFTRWIRKPIISLMMMGIVGAVMTIIIYVLNGFSDLSYFNIGLAFVSGFLYLYSIYLYFRAVQVEEISRVVPLYYITPLFVLILASVFLGEIFTPLRYLGILMLVAGAMLISSRNLLRLHFGKGFWFVLLSCFVISFSMLINKYLLGYADFWSVFSYTRMGVFIALVPFYFMNFKDILATIKKHGKRSIALVSVSETLNLVAVLLFTIATASGYLTLVDALSSVQPFFVLVFTVVLSRYLPKILKEEVSRKTVLLKLFAILIMFLGALLISYNI